MTADRRRDAVHGTAAPEHLERWHDDPSVTRVEARGTWCPEPLLRLQRAAADRPPGGVIVLTADDPGIELDVPAWCLSTGHEYLGTLRRSDGLFAFVRLARQRGDDRDQPKR